MGGGGEWWSKLSRNLNIFLEGFEININLSDGVDYGIIYIYI